MTFDRMRNRLVRTLSLTALAVLFLGVANPAQGTGTIPPGTIYYNQLHVNYMSMNGDGSGKKFAPISFPSYQRHAGSRWSLGGKYVDGPLDPNGNPPWELFAANESQQDYRLTNDPTIHWYYWDPPTWSKDDSFVSFSGLKNTAAGVVGGLFVMNIDWSTGVPVARPPSLILPVDVAISPSWWAWSEPNLHKHDWSPTASSVVYETYDATGAVQLNVATFAGGVGTTRSLTSGQSPAWSMDGNRIAFDRGEIWTIKPDGTAALRITQASTNKTQRESQSGPTWSPDGAFLAYTDTVTQVKNSTNSYAIWRIPAGGGTAVNLTSGFANCLAPMWRL